MHIPCRRNAARIAFGFPAVLSAWAMLVGLPLAPVAPGRGHLVTRKIALTGMHAAVRPDGPDRAGSAEARAAADGWSATVPVDAGTQSVALSWTGAPSGAAQIRARSGGRWSAWTTEAADPDEGPDTGGNGRTGIGPVWLGHGGADRVQVRVQHGPLTDLALEAMRWERPVGGFGLPTAGAEPAEPAIHPRSEWSTSGWRSDNPGCTTAPVVMSNLTFAVIHHTVNANTYQPDDVPGMLAAIYHYHTDSLGWCDIAYNFVIDRFGRTWQGRSGDVTKPIMGGHAKGFNTSSLGVAFLGQYEPGASPTVDHPSQAALDAARDLVAWKFGIHGIDPTATVRVQSGGSTKYDAGVWVTIPTMIGHRDISLTACPGDYLFSRIPDMRTAVAARLAAGGGAWAPFTSATALVAQQFRDVLRREASSSEIASWAGRLLGGSWSIGQFVATLLSSSEADRRVSSVVRLYYAFFLRPPDHGGITYWIAQREGGRSLSSIAEPFASSSEFRNRYGHLADADYVGRVYENVLGRSADASGRAFWEGRLAAGTPRGQMMANFSESSEYVTKSRNGVLLAASFEAMLRRAVDPGALTYYGSRLDAGTRLSSIDATLFASDEYRRRF